MQSAKQDYLQLQILKNKWYIDEIYDFALIKPSIWFAETFVYKWMDKALIDGTLDMVGKATASIGSTIRNYFDLPVINRFFGDGTSNLVKWTGRNLRRIQSGRVQQYMLVSFVMLIVIAGLLYYLLVFVLPVRSL